MKDNSGKKLIIKIIALLLLGIIILFIESKMGYSKIPFNRVALNELKKDTDSKVKQIKSMNQQIEDMNKNMPALIKNADKLAKNALVAVDRKEENMVDIPSILVYVEQTGKDVGLTVKKIDIAGLDNSGKSLQAAQRKDGRQNLNIAAKGSYKSLVDFLREIQINTNKKITVEGFKFTSIDKAMKTCSVELEISI